MCRARWLITGALGGSIAVIVSPLGYRTGCLSLGVAFLFLSSGLLALTLAEGTAIICFLKTRGGEMSRDTLAALIVGAGIGVVPLWFVVAAVGAPPIHDVTTDTRDPPIFNVAVSHNTAGRTDYAGERIASKQRAAYPDIKPMMLDVRVGVAFRRAVDVARSIGWDLLAVDVNGHLIEASDRTFWFGFIDDIVVRVRSDEDGSRVDVRSLSRVGVGDAGTNASRIRSYLDRLAGL